MAPSVRARWRAPFAFDRAVEECLHPLVDLADQPADLALRHPAGAHGAHQIIDRAGRHALHIGLLDRNRPIGAAFLPLRS